MRRCWPCPLWSSCNHGFPFRTAPQSQGPRSFLAASRHPETTCGPRAAYVMPGASDKGAVINYGERGGPQNGKIAGRNVLRPPSRQGKTFRAPLLKEWEHFAPPPIWLKLQATEYKLPQNFLCPPPFSMAKTFFAPLPFRRGKTLHAPPPIYSPSLLPVFSGQSLICPGRRRATGGPLE